MTLYDLKPLLDFTFDIDDDVVCGSFYIELDEIPDEEAKRIEVVRITPDLVTCKLTEYLQRIANFRPSAMVDYLDQCYEGAQLEYLTNQLTKRNDNPYKGITDDHGEAVAFFIERHMYDFLTDYVGKEQAR